MKRAALFLILACITSVSYADDVNSFAQGVAQALERQYELQHGQQPSPNTYNPIPNQQPSDSVYLQQQSLDVQQQQLEVQRQQLQEQQNQNAWWNK